MMLRGARPCAPVRLQFFSETVHFGLTAFFIGNFSENFSETPEIFSGARRREGTEANGNRQRSLIVGWYSPFFPQNTKNILVSEVLGTGFAPHLRGAA